MATYVRKKKRASPKPKKSSKSKKHVPRKRKPVAKKAAAKKVAGKKTLARKPPIKPGRRTVAKRSGKGKGGTSGPVAKRLRSSKITRKKRGIKRPTERKISKKVGTEQKLKRRPVAQKSPKRRRPARRRAKTTTAARGSLRKKRAAVVKTIAAKLDRERSKLKAKKLRLDKPKLKKQRAAVQEIKEKLEDIVAPAGGRRNEREERAAHYEQMFSGMLRLAIEKKQLPKTDFRKRKVNTEDRQGDQRAVHANIMLDDAGVEEAMHLIEEAVRKIPGKYFYWISHFDLCGMGERLIGYGNRILQANHPDAHNFQIAFDSSGVSSSVQQMLILARETLEDYASEQYTLVMLLNIRVVNFGFKER